MELAEALEWSRGLSVHKPSIMFQELTWVKRSSIQRARTLSDLQISLTELASGARSKFAFLHVIRCSKLMLVVFSTRLTLFGETSGFPAWKTWEFGRKLCWKKYPMNDVFRSSRKRTMGHMSPNVGSIAKMADVVHIFSACSPHDRMASVRGRGAWLDEAALLNYLQSGNPVVAVAWMNMNSMVFGICPELIEFLGVTGTKFQHCECWSSISCFSRKIVLFRFCTLFLFLHLSSLQHILLHPWHLCCVSAHSCGVKRGYNLYVLSQMTCSRKQSANVMTDDKKK